MKYSKGMYDEDFLNWIREMPIGYMQYLWRMYNMSYTNDSPMPTIGDNFTLVARIDFDPIQQFEDDLMADRITLQDLIRREE